VLDAQRDAWNRGDIEGYMDGMPAPKDTVFVSGDNVNVAGQTVLDRLQEKLQLSRENGTLTFSDLEITLVGNDRRDRPGPLASETGE